MWANTSKGGFGFLLWATLAVVAAACSKPPAGTVDKAPAGLGGGHAGSAAPVFSLWAEELVCTDTLTAAWLIRRFVAPDAQFRLYPKGTLEMEGTPLGVPQAELRLDRGKTCTEAVVERLGIEDPTVPQLVEIIRDIELNKWAPKKTAEAAGLDAIVRGLEGDPGAAEKQLELGFAVVGALFADLKNRGR